MPILRKAFFQFVSSALLVVVFSAFAKAEVDFEKLFDERLSSVVAVEFFIQQEVEREPAIAIGLVFDEEGRVVLLDTAIPSWLPPERFRDFRVHHLGEDAEGYEATYLGQDYLTGYHFIQIEENQEAFTSVAKFGSALPKRGDLIWGIGVMGKQWAFLPYFLSGRLSAVEPLPWDIGFSDTPVASPGSVVFDESGTFVGWAGSPVTQDKVIFLGNDRHRAAIQDVRESTMFLTAEEFYKHIQRVPSKPIGDPRPWLGVSGMQPLDREAATYLGLEKQGSLVISDVIEEGPAEAAGLQSRDIIVALDGEPLPKLKPDFVVPRYFERKVLTKDIGDTIKMTVIRGDETMEIDANLIQQPTPLKEAQRVYFPELGLAIREFTLYDGIARRILRSSDEGVIVDFVKPNSQVNSAGLVSGDWIKEVDGQKVKDFAEAEAIFTKLEEEQTDADFVILVSRNGETKVLRVKRK
ncbi:PDZ domain-containing protein [Rubellicoccus peritrichatus]|uniref:PDZ domain-containing protein n=1 Tax=Rubellicoccus peritrichatus TaxID=3080537 RepID=A0AAQ3LG70_9BACT|nr:PDZ domain-containing protein [Puniceicoccus sp. CR14]WOO43243.1 PDZ domain-containing protein [Puniceicoccus sp. CR14]